LGTWKVISRLDMASPRACGIAALISSAATHSSPRTDRAMIVTIT